MCSQSPGVLSGQGQGMSGRVSQGAVPPVPPQPTLGSTSPSSAQNQDALKSLWWDGGGQGFVRRGEKGFPLFLHLGGVLCSMFLNPSKSVSEQWCPQQPEPLSVTWGKKMPPSRRSLNWRLQTKANRGAGGDEVSHGNAADYNLNFKIHTFFCSH